MTILEKAVSTMQQLPIEKQQEVLSFIEFLVFKLDNRQLASADVDLDELCDRAAKLPQGVEVVHDNRSYVLVTHEEWESLTETAELMKVPNLLEQVKSARQEYQNGEVLTMEQMFG